MKTGWLERSRLGEERVHEPQGTLRVQPLFSLNFLHSIEVPTPFLPDNPWEFYPKPGTSPFSLPASVKNPGKYPGSRRTGLKNAERKRQPG